MVFYHIYHKDKSFVDYAEGNDWEGIICPLNDGHQGAGKRTTILTLEFVRAKIVDFSWTTLADLVITDHALNALRSANLTGFRVEPIKIVPPTRKIYKRLGNPKLWEVIITGDGGYAHPDSKIELIDACPACGYKKYEYSGDGIIVDESQWDGSDLFVVREYTKYILVTEKVREAIERNDLTNVTFIPSNEVWKDE